MARILISAGEASGETYGAQLIAALRQQLPVAGFFGLGGDQMRAAGNHNVIEARDVAVVGLAEVIKHLPAIYAHFHRLLKEVDRSRPDVAVLIDFPDFNLRLARELHKRKIPVVYFVSPQLWAWRKSRIHQVKRYVSKMLVIFPFEEKFYRDHGVDATFVGHPLADMLHDVPSRAAFASANQLDIGKQWIALLPGSRRQEVERHLPEMAKAAALLGEGYEFLLPVASTLSRDWVAQHLPDSANIKLVSDAFAALSYARASIVASGTATVEAALAGNPFVVVYRVSPLTYLLGRRLVDLPNFAMVNLIAGRSVVPELIQNDFTAEKIVAHLKPMLEEGAQRQTMLADLLAVQSKLRAQSGSGVMERAAAHVLKLLPGKSPVFQ